MSKKIYLQSHFGFREDTLENWQNANPILEKGEISIVSDGEDGRWLKTGDGKTPWNSLPYKLGPKGENGKDAVTDQTYNPESQNAQSGVAVAEALADFSGNGVWETIADITIPEGFSSYSYAITEATYPDMKKITDFYIEMVVPKQSEIVSGDFTVLINPIEGAKCNIARFSSWNHTNYNLKGFIFSKLYGKKRHNQYYGFGANATQSLNNYSLLNGLNGGNFFEIIFSLSDTTKVLPAGVQIKIVGCKR